MQLLYRSCSGCRGAGVHAHVLVGHVYCPFNIAMLDKRRKLTLMLRILDHSMADRTFGAQTSALVATEFNVFVIKSILPNQYDSKVLETQGVSMQPCYLAEPVTVAGFQSCHF